jgi:hypothetical protein
VVVVHLANDGESGGSRVNTADLLDETLLSDESKHEKLHALLARAARAVLGSTPSDVKATLSAQDATLPFESKLRERLDAQGVPVPSRCAALLVLGGPAALRLAHAIVATAATAMVLDELDEDVLNKDSAVMNTAASEHYVLDDDGMGVAKIVKPDVYIRTKAPRRECGWGCDSDYCDAFYLIEAQDVQSPAPSSKQTRAPPRLTRVSNTSETKESESKESEPKESKRKESKPEMKSFLEDGTYFAAGTRDLTQGLLEALAGDELDAILLSAFNLFVLTRCGYARHHVEHELGSGGRHVAQCARDHLALRLPRRLRGLLAREASMVRGRSAERASLVESRYVSIWVRVSLGVAR